MVCWSIGDVCLVTIDSGKDYVHVVTGCEPELATSSWMLSVRVARTPLLVIAHCSKRELASPSTWDAVLARRRRRLCVSRAFADGAASQATRWLSAV